MRRLLLTLAVLVTGATQAHAARAPLQFEASHSHALTEANARVGFLLDYWHQRFGIEAQREGDSASVSGEVYGIDINGTITVENGRVVARVNDPGPFFRGRVTSYIDRMLRKYLHPSYQAP